MRRLLTGLVLILIASAIAFQMLAPGFRADMLKAPDQWPGGKFALFEVKQGAAASSVARELAEKGLVRSAAAFKAMLRRQGWEQKLKPGLYRLEPGSDALKIAEQIVNNDTWRVKVTLPEGLTLKQIAQRIEKAGKTPEGQWTPSADEIIAQATPELLQQVTGIRTPTDTVEGYLFPATYTFQAGASAKQVLSTLMTEFVDRFSGRYRDEIQRNKLSLNELATVASIVEREARTDKERPLIAQVFLNRLAIGMKLESCATVQYALPEHKARLLNRDLRIQSPYNTYIHTGLPPGPICNSGEASLMAALRPEPTDALYFVSRGDGTHVFSRTFAQHQAAIRRIRNQ